MRLSYWTPKIFSPSQGSHFGVSKFIFHISGADLGLSGNVYFGVRAIHRTQWGISKMAGSPNKVWHLERDVWRSKMHGEWAVSVAFQPGRPHQNHDPHTHIVLCISHRVAVRGAACETGTRRSIISLENRMKKRCRCEQKKRRQPVLLRKSQAASQRILLHPAVKSFSRAARMGVSDPEPPWRRLNCIMCAPLSGKNRSVDLLLLQNRMHKRQTAFIAATFGRLIFPLSRRSCSLLFALGFCFCGSRNMTNVRGRFCRSKSIRRRRCAIDADWLFFSLAGCEYPPSVHQPGGWNQFLISRQEMCATLRIKAGALIHLPRWERKYFFCPPAGLISDKKKRHTFAAVCVCIISRAHTDVVVCCFFFARSQRPGAIN